MRQVRNIYPRYTLGFFSLVAAGVVALFLLPPLQLGEGWRGELLLFLHLLAWMSASFGGLLGIITFLASFFQHGDNLRDVRDASKPREF